MKKRLFTWLLCVAILLTISPLRVFAAETVASGTCGDNLTWMLDDAGTLTISGTGAMGDCSATTSPWVTHKDLIKAVILDEGVTAIGDYAFYNCENLTNITLPSTLQTVGEYAFYKCKNLQYVSGTSAIARVYDYAFYGCEKMPSLPGANLRTVGQWAFAYCAALSQMDLQTSMVNDGFGTGAFYGCTSLKKITIPTSVNSIPSSAFSGCSGLETVNAHGQIVTINSSAFSGCVSLTNFSIPGWVTHIYSGAFENSGLGNVSIGASVQYVAPDAFAGCRNLQNINVSSSNSTYKSFSGVLFSNNGTVLYTYPAGRSGEVQIPYTGYALKKIGMYAFSGCSGITGIQVPNQCTNIGSCAFENCTSLTSVTFTATYQGAGVTTIGNMAFDGCTSLENIIFPGGMQSIGNGLFANCTGLKQVCIPDSVTSIDATAFTDCTNLKNVLYGGTRYEWDDLASDNDDFADVTIHYNIVYYLNHWTVKSKNPTCTTAGYRKEECACGYTRNEETYEPTGEHIFDKQEIADTYWVSDATCQSPAIYKKSCVCGLASDTETFTVGNAEPDKHNFVDTVCTDCGIIGGQCGSTVYWTLDADGLLSISGTGDMADYAAASDAPWYASRTAIKTVVIEERVTSIGEYAFLDCSCLEDVYYGGTESEWDGLSNTPNVTRIHYNCPTADGHWTEGQTPPTCGETGVSFEACSCGYKRNEETIPATGEHAYESVVIPTTCEENGYTTYTCANCGDTYTGDETAAEGHIWSDATCTAPMTCSVCHAVEEGSALGHDWGEWEETKAASCTEDGSKTRSCRRCGENETETVPATDHTPDENGVCTVCGDIPIVASGTWGDNITWTLDAAGKLTFSGEGAMLNCGVQGGAWYSLRDKIYTVQVEEGITSLGSYAFTNCGNLTTVILPDSLRTIGGSVFTQCGDLAEITMPEHLERIEAYAFSYSGLVSVAIPESVTYLGEYAFTDCTKLKTFTVPATFTKVPAGLLYGCKSLESVTIPEGITVIGEKAFCNCYALKRADIPAGVTKLEREAFAYNSALEAVTLPEGLLTIDTYAFAGCTKLTEINLPNSVVSLGGCLFSGCSNLVSAHLPENITELPGDLFYNCLKLENVNIPESVTAIGGGAFQHTSITEITIPEGVSILEISVLRLCSGLTSVTIPENVTQVRSAAFQDCDNLTEIIFTGHAPSIDSSAFTRVTATVYYPLNDPSWTADVMKNYGGTLTWKGYNSENPFTDVQKGSFYYEPVMWAIENGVTSGTSETSFGPNDACLRAHVVTFLWRAAGSPEPTNSQNPFVDVAETGFYYKAVLWAVEKGITTGSDATHFNPFGVCNRAAVVTFLWRAAGSPEPKSTNNPFVDVTTTAFYYKAVLWAVENGITNGVDATHFGPTADCNRAQVVTFLYRVYNK